MKHSTFSGEDLSASKGAAICGGYVNALLEESFSTIHRFAISGSAFLAVPQTDWVGATAERGRQRFLHKLVVGRININGVCHVVFAARPPPGAVIGKPSIAHTLTPRELQVAIYVAEGKCDKEIARSLGISNYTVREHMRRIFHKLNISRRTALVALLLGQAGQS